MVAINFSSQFVGLVGSGVKRQTIRRTKRCKPGDSIQLYTGMRTKSASKIGEVVCMTVTPIEIDYCCAYLDDKKLLSQEADKIAEADGFKGYTDMAEWFDKKYGILPFKGFLIKW